MFISRASSTPQNVRSADHYSNLTQESESNPTCEASQPPSEFNQKVEALSSSSRPPPTKKHIQKISSDVNYLLGLSDNTENTFFKKNRTTISKDPWLNTWSISDIKDVQHLKDCLQSDIPTGRLEAWPNVKEELKELALALPDVFKEESKGQGQIAELVELAAINDLEIYCKTFDAITRECSFPQLEWQIAQGLADILRNCSVKQLLGSEKICDLVPLIPSFKTHLKNLSRGEKYEEKTLLIALQTISQLLDTMFLVGVSDIDREGIHEALDNVLNKLRYQGQWLYLKKNEISWQASYAKQALAHLPNDETRSQYWWRQIKDLGYTAGSLIFFAGLNRGLLLKKAFFAAIDHSPNLLLGGMAKLWPSSMKIYKWHQSTSIEKWYVTLRFTDLLIEEGELVALEKFVRHSEDAKNKNFLLGFCLRLKQLACVQQDIESQLVAIEFLGDLEQNHEAWGNHAEVKEAVKIALTDLKKILDGEPLRKAETILRNRFNVKNEASARTFNTDAKLSQNTLLGLARKKILINSNLKALKNIDSNIYDLYQTYLKKLEKTDSIKDALAHYVDLEAVLPDDDGTEERYKLHQTVKDFLANEEKHVLLLLGKAGSGKSTFCHHLTSQLWKDYLSTEEQAFSQLTPRIPLFIALPKLIHSGEDVITKELKKQEFPEIHISSSLRNTRRFVFILDEYDEVAKYYTRFYETNRLDQWQDAKFIITACQGRLKSHYESQLYPSGQLDILQKAEIVPFSDETVDAYIKNYADKKHFASWDADKYLSMLNGIPALNAQKHHPFSLQMALDLLPALSEAAQQESSSPIQKPFNHIERYDRFMSSWVNRSNDCFDKVEWSEEDRRFFAKQRKLYSATDIINFSQNFAVELHKHDKLEASYPPTSDEEQSWLEPFLGDSKEAQLFRASAPLMQEGDTYRFIHEFIQDYLVSRAICGPAFVPKQLKATAVLNKCPLMSHTRILDFLVDRVKQQPNFKEHLYQWIRASKNPAAGIECGAANAITVLVRAGEVFSGEDLKSISIPFANLEGGIFDGTKFDKANLTGVNFSSAWLRGCSFNSANMHQVQFGNGSAVSSVQGVDFIEKIEISPNGDWLASYGPESILSFQSLTSTSASLAIGKVDSKKWITFSSDDRWVAWPHAEGYIAYENIIDSENRMYFETASNDKCAFSSDNLHLIVPTLQKEKNPQTFEEQCESLTRLEELKSVCLKLKIQHQALLTKLETLSPQLQTVPQVQPVLRQLLPIIGVVTGGIIAGPLGIKIALITMREPIVKTLTSLLSREREASKKKEVLALKNELDQKEAQLQALRKQIYPKIKIQFLSMASGTVDSQAEIYTAGEITSIAFSADRKFLFTAEKEAANTEKAIIKKWDLTTGQLAENIYPYSPLNELETIVNAPNFIRESLLFNESDIAVDTPTSILEIVPSPHGKWLALVEKEEEGTQSIRLCLLETLSITPSIKRSAASIKLRFSPNEQWLAAAQGNELMLISTQSGALQSTRTGTSSGVIHAMGWQQENGLLTIGGDHILRTWKVIDEEPQTSRLQLMAKSPQTGLRFAQMSIVEAKALSADNISLLNQFKVQKEKLPDDVPDTPVLSDNGRWMALAKIDKKEMHPTRITLSSLETETTFKFKLASTRAAPRAFSPNSQWLVVADTTQLVLISTRSGESQKTQEEKSTTVIHKISWLGNDSLSTIGTDYTLRKWKIVTSQDQNTFALWLIE